MSYSIKEAAKAMNVSTRQVRRYIKDGKLEAVTVQGKYGPEYEIKVIPDELIHQTETPGDSPADVSLIDYLKNENVRLQEENRQLIGQLGIYQERARQAEDRILQLTSPEHRPPWYKRLFNF